MDEALAHGGNFFAIFGQVTVDEYAWIVAGQAPRGLQLGARGGQRKARRDGVVQPVATVPGLDQFARLTLALGSAVAQAVGTLNVHQCLACNHAQAALQGHLEERLDRTPVYGGEHLCRGRAVGQQLVEEKLRRRARIDGIGKALFGREGIALEPVEQITAAGTDDIGLRIVNVRIDEARQDESLAMLDDAQLPRVRQQFGSRSNRLDMGARNDQRPLLPVLVCLRFVQCTRVGAKMQDASAVRDSRRVLHRAAFSSRDGSCARVRRADSAGSSLRRGRSPPARR